MPILKRYRVTYEEVTLFQPKSYTADVRALSKENAMDIVQNRLDSAFGNLYYAKEAIRIYGNEIKYPKHTFLG